MIVLGVVPTSKDVLMCILKGDRENPTEISLDRTTRKQKTVIDGKDETLVLYELYEFVRTVINAHSIKKIIILRAGESWDSSKLNFSFNVSNTTAGKPVAQRAVQSYPSNPTLLSRISPLTLPVSC